MCVALQRIGSFGGYVGLDLGDEGVLVFTAANDLALGIPVFERHDGADHIQPAQFGATFAVGDFRHRHRTIQPCRRGSPCLLQKPGDVGIPEVLHAAVNFRLSGLDVLIGKNAGAFSRTDNRADGQQHATTTIMPDLDIVPAEFDASGGKAVQHDLLGKMMENDIGIVVTKQLVDAAQIFH